MRQRVVHGATLDIATPSEVASIVDALTANVQENYTRRKGVVALNASGNGQASDEDLVVSAQYDWLCQRVTLGGGPLAANALVSFYENDAGSDANLLEVVQLGTAGKYSDSFSNEMYVPANSKLIIAVTGGPATDGQVTYNIQIRYIKHRP